MPLQVTGYTYKARDTLEGEQLSLKMQMNAFKLLCSELSLATLLAVDHCGIVLQVTWK